MPSTLNSHQEMSPYLAPSPYLEDLGKVLAILVVLKQNLCKMCAVSER